MEITAETIKQNYPGVYWEIYRLGFGEAQEDRGVQERAAKQHLEHALTSPATASQASTKSRPGVITPEQAKVNAQLGLSPEMFAEYNSERPSRLDPVQAKMNERLGLKEADFLKFNTPR